MESTNKTFGKNLRRLIDKKGLKYQRAADDIGISLSFLNNLMRGLGGPSLDMIYQISKGLRVSPEDLFSESNGRSKPDHSALLLELYALLPKLTEVNDITNILDVVRGLVEHDSATSTNRKPFKKAK